MLTFLCENVQALTNSIGLLFDIAGAWLVGWEVVRQYRGQKVRVGAGVLRSDYLGSDGTPVVAGQHAENTEEYKTWELKKYLRMKLGLFFLTIGFLLQLVSNWLTKYPG